ncbi:hypothetical protein SAMN02745857_02987 [Andreprevotia lacus DSM 23236]|uniref:Transmembrane protein n=1 Tax=Andreprevotia lacus DSM 23236 TaxID=1121001 RepID=A0A1W1XWB1_9NEIS|nr:hypothetical protein [Andreprevotia lacus]SMC27831.1 hypothetical protein SAMN02745857_02987 [Andreprevotia lacus DSM 23236]
MPKPSPERLQRLRQLAALLLALCFFLPLSHCSVSKKEKPINVNASAPAVAAMDARAASAMLAAPVSAIADAPSPWRPGEFVTGLFESDQDDLIIARAVSGSMDDWVYVLCFGGLAVFALWRQPRSRRWQVVRLLVEGAAGAGASYLVWFWATLGIMRWGGLLAVLACTGYLLLTAWLLVLLGRAMWQARRADQQAWSG